MPRSVYSHYHSLVSLNINIRSFRLIVKFVRTSPSIEGNWQSQGAKVALASCILPKLRVMENVVVGLNAITRKWLRNHYEQSSWLPMADGQMERLDPPLAEDVGNCCALCLHDLELKCYRTATGHYFHEFPQRIVSCGFEKLIFLTLRTATGEAVDGSLWDEAEIQRLVELWPQEATD